jgi:hypothetical protein
MRSNVAALLLLLASTTTDAKTGLIGYGQLWYDPPCAYACRAVIGNAPLKCASMDHSNMDMGGHSHGGSPMVPCIAENDAFLLTLAHCLSTRCSDISASKLETYWDDHTTGDKSVDAKWTYGAALANVERPARTYVAGETLNYTALISDESYEYQYDFNVHFDWEETVQSNFV